MNFSKRRLGFIEFGHTTIHVHFPPKIVSRVNKETVLRRKKKELTNKPQILYVDV